MKLKQALARTGDVLIVGLGLGLCVVCWCGGMKSKYAPARRRRSK